MVIAAAARFIPIGSSQCNHCHSEGIGCSTSFGVTNSWIRSPLEVQRTTSDHLESRFKYQFLGDIQFHWFPAGRRSRLSKVSVAADYSDSVPDSSSYEAKNGYHPLEEIKTCKPVRETKLTAAEIAKTTIEANSSALLIFPGVVHSEPHENISWVEYPYVMNTFGDIYFEVSDDVNIMLDPGSSNPVNALIGMDLPLFAKQRLSVSHYGVSESFIDEVPFVDDYFEDDGPDMLDRLEAWGIANGSRGVHPIYFAKCLTKAVDMEYARRMDHPSNGVSVMGYLRPAYADEELYLRRLFNSEDSDGYGSDLIDGDVVSFNSRVDGNYCGSIFYRLEIMRVELFSVYGVQSAISLQDFRDAEPDILVHSIPEIVKHFGEDMMSCNLALRALCKKKGLHVEEATIIGIDSLGMDVRVFTGLEVRTHRFPFKIRAISEKAAEKQIRQLLFTKSQRKRATRTRDSHQSN